MILKTLKHAKTAERNSTTSECIFHKQAVKNVIVNVVKTIYRQHNSIFLAKKNLLYSLFDWPESGFVPVKKYLAGHHDWRPAVRYFQPCFNIFVVPYDGFFCIWLGIVLYILDLRPVEEW